jgi:hypothetical protein
MYAVLGLPSLTKARYQTKIQRISHVSTLTIPYQDLRSLSGSHWWIWFGPPRAYQLLPRPCMCRRTLFGWSGSCYHRLPKSQSGCRPAACGLYQALPPRRGLDIMYCYNVLELVVGGAVDEGDVVLVFIGQHTGTGCEVLGRPVWHFDRVCDLLGILATGH